MKDTFRIALKVVWMATLLLVFSLFSVEVVDFVYTGF